MIVTNNILKENLEEYGNKNTKISREVKKGNLIKLKNGLYETNNKVSGYCLAGAIYGPSYLSFDFALSYYGLIPERVTAYTSATCNKKKKKIFENYYGTYLYRDIPQNVYPFGVQLVEEGEYIFQIAVPEKALCDKLYTLKPIKNLKEMENMLIIDLRIDMDELYKFNLEDLEELTKLYHSSNVNLLYRYVRRFLNEQCN